MATLKWNLLHRFILILSCAALADAAVPSCPAGLPVGNIQLRVSSASAKTQPLSIRLINRIEEGDTISYAPILRPNERRTGKVTVVLVPASKEERKEQAFEILDPKPADKPAQWQVPFRVSLAVYVYGPSGLSVGKVKGFLSKDDELISQLAEYAEKTEKTEALLTALAATPDASTGQDMGAAMQGFAGQSGLNNKIDRTVPMDQQTLAMLRGINPALSTYDPIAPEGPQRLGQTAGLATAVAGMFFGSTVGLAAGGAAMLMNLETMMFPNAEFRSSFAQPFAGDALTVCGKRDPPHGRTRLAYLWALRIPNSGPPHISITPSDHLPLGLKSPLKVDVPESEWPLVDRIREWKLGNVPVTVKADAKNHALDIDLSKAHLSAAEYELRGMWDWDQFVAKGAVHLHPLSTFEHAKLTPDSHDRLVQHSGKQIVQIEGDDFEFVDKVALVKIGDKYDAPVDVPFSIPGGKGEGPEERLEMRLDTSSLDAGAYSLELVQSDGKKHDVPVQVVAEPPRIVQLPIELSTDEAKQQITIQGEHLDRIEKLDAGPVKLDLGAASPDGKRRTVTADLPVDPRQGSAFDLRVVINQYAKPLVIPSALMFAGPRVRIVDAKIALPTDLEVSPRAGELPAGVVLSAMVHVQNASPKAELRLSCQNGEGPAVTVRLGEQTPAAKLQAISADTLFLSFDPGNWLTGCTLTATLENPGEEASAPHRLGRVMRVPRIDSLRLTDEAAGDGNYVGILTGRDLEGISKAGWDADHGTVVATLPTAIAEQPNKQSLRIELPWPSPAPHSPIYVWLRGDKDGRPTTVKY